MEKGGERKKNMIEKKEKIAGKRETGEQWLKERR